MSRRSNYAFRGFVYDMVPFDLEKDIWALTSKEDVYACIGTREQILEQYDKMNDFRVVAEAEQVPEAQAEEVTGQKGEINTERYFELMKAVSADYVLMLRICHFECMKLCDRYEDFIEDYIFGTSFVGYCAGRYPRLPVVDVFNYISALQQLHLYD